MLKKEIRKSWLQKRMELPEQELQDKTVMMVWHFNNLRLPPFKHLLSYYALTEKKEFDVSVCEQVVKEHDPAVKVAWPRLGADLTCMEAYIVEGEEFFARNKFNILEPIGGQWVPPQLVDVVFIPLLGFDEAGYRVGYGKGCYDRYLVRCRPDVIKIGFSFFDPIDRIGDIDQFDVPLNYCITPSRIYEF